MNKLKYQFCVILMSRLSIIAVKILEKQSLHVIVQLQSYVQTIYLYTRNMAETSSDICIPYVLESDKIPYILIRFVLLLGAIIITNSRPILFKLKLSFHMYRCDKKYMCRHLTFYTIC